MGNDWSKHVITVKKERNGATFIDFAIPNTGFFAMQFIIYNGKLIVSGDYGSAVYNYFYPISLNMFKRTKDINYFCSKCAASEDGRFFKKFDLDKALNELKQVYYEYSEYDYEDNSRLRKKQILYEVYEVFEHIDTIEDYSTYWDFVRDFGYKYYGSEWYEYDGEFYSNRAKIHAEAICYVANNYIKRKWWEFWKTR